MFHILFYYFWLDPKVTSRFSKDPHNPFHLPCVSTRREAVQPFSCKSPSRTGLPTIHCFKRLEATSGVTSGLYCRPSLRSVVERFFHFPSSSSDVPVIPTSSPLSPDGKHRRTSPSTASGNPPAPVTGVPVSPLLPHRTKARCLSGCVRATPVLPKAGSAAPPHGRKRQTPLSPAGERANRSPRSPISPAASTGTIASAALRPALSASSITRTDVVYRFSKAMCPVQSTTPPYA